MITPNVAPFISKNEPSGADVRQHVCPSLLTSPCCGATTSSNYLGKTHFISKMGGGGGGESAGHKFCITVKLQPLQR